MLAPPNKILFDPVSIMKRLTNHGLFIITLFVYHKLLEARMYFVGTSEQSQSSKKANLTKKYLINVRSLKITSIF